MPPMKIQPIDFRADDTKPAPKSRLKRLFDRPFPSVLRISSADKATGAGDAQNGKDGGPATATEFEPSSVCLARMVQNFIEESNDRQSASKCIRNRCNCFNGNSNDSSDDELDVFEGFTESVTVGSSGDASDALKGLVPCASVAERNLLADTARIVEKNKTLKRKDDLRKMVTENLSSLGYDASICKSKWDRTSSHPSGEYEYIDAIVEGERLLIDIDFRSEFEIARSTGTYKAIIQSLPYVFVGKTDRLAQIVRIVSEAAKQNLKKKGMHFPPWRKAEYMQAKWLAPYTRAAVSSAVLPPKAAEDGEAAAEQPDRLHFELIFGEEKTVVSELDGGQASSEVELTAKVTVQTWQPPAVRPKSSVERGVKVVTGLASLLRERP